MSKNNTPAPIAPGCYFDCSAGVYNHARVIQLAKEHGFKTTLSPSKINNYPDNANRTFLLWTVGEEVLEQVERAEKFLNTLCPAGHWFGATENGDWGVWPNEDHDEEADEPTPLQIGTQVRVTDATHAMRGMVGTIIDTRPGLPVYNEDATEYCVSIPREAGKPNAMVYASRAEIEPVQPTEPDEPKPDTDSSQDTDTPYHLGKIVKIQAGHRGAGLIGNIYKIYPDPLRYLVAAAGESFLLYHHEIEPVQPTEPDEPKPFEPHQYARVIDQSSNYYGMVGQVRDITYDGIGRQCYLLEFPQSHAQFLRSEIAAGNEDITGKYATIWNPGNDLHGVPVFISTSHPDNPDVFILHIYGKAAKVAAIHYSGLILTKPEPEPAPMPEDADGPNDEPSEDHPLRLRGKCEAYGIFFAHDDNDDQFRLAIDEDDATRPILEAIEAVYGDDWLIVARRGRVCFKSIYTSDPDYMRDLVEAIEKVATRDDEPGKIAGIFADALKANYPEHFE